MRRVARVISSRFQLKSEARLLPEKKWNTHRSFREETRGGFAYSRNRNEFAGFESPKNREQVTIIDMFLAILGMRILTLMFFVGLVGSAVVVLISFWEDGKELFGKD
jgi:hypothetical protein